MPIMPLSSGDLLMLMLLTAIVIITGVTSWCDDELVQMACGLVLMGLCILGTLLAGMR